MTRREWHRLRARVRFLAGRDGIAHAHRPGHPRTVCGLLSVREAHAWPERERCWTCAGIVAHDAPEQPR